jgi:hypothetical protein
MFGARRSSAWAAVFLSSCPGFLAPASDLRCSLPVAFGGVAWARFRPSLLHWKRGIAVDATVFLLNCSRGETEEMPASYEMTSPASGFRGDQIAESDWAETGVRSLTDVIQEYARNQPLTFGLWALGIGFVLGWKLKPW